MFKFPVRTVFLSEKNEQDIIIGRASRHNSSYSANVSNQSIDSEGDDGSSSPGLSGSQLRVESPESLYFSERTVSKVHAKINVTYTDYGVPKLVIYDENSQHGTIVNDKVINEENTHLYDGDYIGLVHMKLKHNSDDQSQDFDENADWLKSCKVILKVNVFSDRLTFTRVTFADVTKLEDPPVEKEVIDISNDSDFGCESDVVENQDSTDVHSEVDPVEEQEEDEEEDEDEGHELESEFSEANDSDENNESDRDLIEGLIAFSQKIKQDCSSCEPDYSAEKQLDALFTESYKRKFSETLEESDDENSDLDDDTGSIPDPKRLKVVEPSVPNAEVKKSIKSLIYSGVCGAVIGASLTFGTLVSIGRSLNTAQ